MRKIDYTSILPSNNFWTHTSQERERATHAKPISRRKEMVLPVKPRTSPQPIASPSCLKLIVTASRSSSSFEALDCCCLKLVVIRSSRSKLVVAAAL